MEYAERLLARGERIRRTSRPHLLGLARRLGRRVVQLTVCVVIARLSAATVIEDFIALPFLADFGVDVWLRPIPGLVRTATMWAGAVILLLCVWDGLRWHATRYVLTDHRVLHIQGVWSKLAIDVPLDRITDSAVRQSLLGIQLDYGDVLVRTAADEEGQPMYAMLEPLAFRQAMESRRLGLAQTRPERAARVRGEARARHGAETQPADDGAQPHAGEARTARPA